MMPIAPEVPVRTAISAIVLQVAAIAAQVAFVTADVTTFTPRVMAVTLAKITPQATPVGPQIAPILPPVHAVVASVSAVFSKITPGIFAHRKRRSQNSKTHQSKYSSSHIASVASRACISLWQNKPCVIPRVA